MNTHTHLGIEYVSICTSTENDIRFFLLNIFENFNDCLGRERSQWTDSDQTGYTAKPTGDSPHNEFLLNITHAHHMPRRALLLWGIDYYFLRLTFVWKTVLSNDLFDCYCLTETVQIY